MVEIAKELFHPIANNKNIETAREEIFLLARMNTETCVTSKIAPLHVMIYHLCGHVAHFVEILVLSGEQ